MAHPDIEQLLNELLPFAQQMLANHGEFYPFGSSMSVEGRITAVATYEGTDHPPSQVLIDMMTGVFQQAAAARQLRAAGICFDVRTIPPGQTEKSNAICVALEHETGEAVDVYVPYKKGWFGKITYGELFATPRVPQCFPQRTAQA